MSAVMKIRIVRGRVRIRVIPRKVAEAKRKAARERWDDHD